MRLLLTFAIVLLALFTWGCESSLPPLHTVEPTFSYVRDGSPDTVIVNATDPEPAVAIVAE